MQILHTFFIQLTWHWWGDIVWSLSVYYFRLSLFLLSWPWSKEAEILSGELRFCMISVKWNYCLPIFHFYNTLQCQMQQNSLKTENRARQNVVIWWQSARILWWKMTIVKFNPNIHIQILHNHLHTFPWKISWENQLKDQEIFLLKIIF